MTTQAQNVKTYAIESGHLNIELSGNTVGTRELWWDDYGQKTCELEKSTTTTKVFGMKDVVETHKLTIIVKDKFWTVDYIDNSGVKGTVPYYNEGQEYVGDMSEKEQQEFADNLLEQMGGSKLESEKVKGYDCDVIEIMGAKSWIYKGLVLKSETKMLGVTANEMLSELKPNSSVSASKFVAPTNVSYTDMNSASQQMGGGTGFGSLSDAYSEMENEDEDEYYDDEPLVPVEYPFTKFKEVIANFSYLNYTCMGTNSIGGMHASSFMSGMNSIMVAAQSKQNAEMDQADAFEKFKHNGHTCYYGKMDDEEDGGAGDGTALLVDYPSHDMYIMIVGIPELSKTELLKISDKLDF
ncbi:MAG: hypothetical protein B6D64_02985 [Bacteroidetes bacterium 4484_276]|nr:MAG: hypothetical protein B6D64_02985 [Bacteroidetes bacterium 4484_276]